MQGDCLSFMSVAFDRQMSELMAGRQALADGRGSNVDVVGDPEEHMIMREIVKVGTRRHFDPIWNSDGSRQ